MPGLLIQSGAIITCPHSGGVSAQSGPRVLLSGRPALTMANVLTVSGCTFQIPTPGGPKPQPCITVRVEAATKVLLNNVPGAILTPVAMCYSIEQIPQGPPNSSAIQKKVIAT